MKFNFKTMLVTATSLLMLLTSCSSGTDYKRVGAGAAGAAVGGLAVKSLGGNKYTIALGLLGGYFVGTGIYDMMTEKDVTILSTVVRKDIKGELSGSGSMSWQNPETKKVYQFTSLGKEGNCNLYKIRAKEAGTDWILNEQHKACIQGDKVVETAVRS